MGHDLHHLHNLLKLFTYGKRSLSRLTSTCPNANLDGLPGLCGTDLNFKQRCRFCYPALLPVTIDA